MLLVGMVIVSMLIGLPSVFSILSLSSSRLHHIETYIETTDANAVVTFTQDIAYELEERVKSYEILVRLIVGAFVIVLVIFTMNLHWSRMLRELLLFGDIRKKEQSSCTEECNDRGL
jgi:predicted PurR-regulated permease PerM